MNCPNCSNKYSEENHIPRILNNCGHTICQICIKKISKISSEESSPQNIVIQCPCCLRETQTKEISNLTKNLALIEIAISNQLPKIELNSSSLNHISTHSEISSNNISATDYVAKKSKKSKILCPEHFKDLEAFCDSCKKLLCVSCIIEKDHKNHDLVSFDKAFQNECISFHENFEKIVKEQEKFEKIQTELSLQKENLQKKYEKQLDTIKNFFQEVYTILNEREKILKEKLRNENEIEEQILNGFEEKMSLLKILVEKIKNMNNNFESLQEVEILSNSLDTAKTFKDIYYNIEEVEKLSAKKEFQFTQLEREIEISVLKDLLTKKLLPQIINISTTTSQKDKSKNLENTVKKSTSISKTKKVSIGSLNTSIHKINQPPPAYIDPIKFNFIKTEVDNNMNAKNSNKVFKLFPQLKSKAPDSLGISNNPSQGSNKLLPTTITNPNISNTAKKATNIVSKIGVIEKNEINSHRENKIGLPNFGNNSLLNQHNISNINNINSPNSDFSLELDVKEFKEINPSITNFEDNLANTSHFMQTLNAINSTHVNEIEMKHNDYANTVNNYVHNIQIPTNNENKFISHNPIKVSNLIHDSNIFYQLNDATSLRHEIDLNDFQMASPDKVLSEIKKSAGNDLNTLADLNNVSHISHANMKSTIIPNDISSIYNKPVNPFLIVLGGKCDYSTKRYSVDQATWIGTNSNFNTTSSNNVINTPSNNTNTNNNSNNPINSSTNNPENNQINSTYDFIKIERSDFVALMYKEKKILIIGGKTVNEKGIEVITDSIDLLNIKEQSLSRLSIKLKHPLLNFGAVYINSKLYIAGGFNGRESLNNFEYFDKINRSWIDLPKMLFKRKEFSIVVGPDNCIYAIGGADDRDIVTKSVEKFDMVKNCWTRISDMNQKRKGCSGVCMPDGIYITGGFDGCQYLKSVERYDFLTKKWTYIEDMNYPRCLFSSCVSSDLQYIYVVGGYDGKPLNTVERYDVFLNKWEILEKLNSPKYRHQCIFLKE